MVITKDWEEYKVLAAGNGEKIEKWGEYVLRRPDGQVIWSSEYMDKFKPDAVYKRSSTGGGNWSILKKIPSRWVIKYKNLDFYVEPTGFKHTGLFPEQAANWDWSIDQIKKTPRKDIKILNLFAYTGAASIACASTGAEVVHVDASKGMNAWAKENYELNKKPGYGVIRFMTDDVKKFVQREIRRGNKYDGIIMDPPVYGRGPNGELWEIEKEINNLLQNVSQLLSDKSLFLILNLYTSNISQISINNLLQNTITKNYKGNTTVDDLVLPIQNSKMFLPCGITARWWK